MNGTEHKPDRLQVEKQVAPSGKERHVIVWRNTRGRDLYLVTLHPLIDKHIAETIAEAMRKRPDFIEQLC